MEASGGLGFFINTWIKFFFILTPSFVLTIFLSITKDMPREKKLKIAKKTTLAVIVICLALYFFCQQIFMLFGITLDAFRIGAGAVLFLSGIKMVGANDGAGVDENAADIAVVPLAIPLTVGPGTIGTILVMAAESQNLAQHLMGLGALSLAALCVGALLMSASWIERILGSRNIDILSKITGLVVCAIAAQIIFTGVKNFMR